MSITVLRGLPGSGKTAQLIEAVNAAAAEGKPVLTFACSDSPRLRAHEMIGVRNLLASRRPGLTFPLHHFVSSEECASILKQTPPGTLVAFEEAHVFGPDIVPHWVEASHRGLDVLIALPSGSRLPSLNGQEYTETVLTLKCQKCDGADASTFFLSPDRNETVSVCADCEQEILSEARQEIRQLLEQEAKYLGENELYQPIELEEYAGWKTVRPDSKKRAQIMTSVIQEAGLPVEGPVGKSTYLDIGCNTGYFCHHVRRLGFHAEGIDLAKREIRVAKLLDSFFRKDFNVYTAVNAYDYLKDTQDRLFDVTSAFSIFQWTMIESLDRAMACLEWLFAKTRRICFLEMGYSSEPHYRGRLPENIDRAWVLKVMEEKGGFSEIRVIDAEKYGLQRDLFIGLKAGATRPAKEKTFKLNGHADSKVDSKKEFMDEINALRAEIQELDRQQRELNSRLSLAEETAAEQLEAQRLRIESLEKRGDDLERSVSRYEYREMRASLGEIVKATIPEGSSVLVISKGDDELLKLDGQKASHFPQNEEGGYAGFNPADSAEAIENLESLRSKGIDYLIIPSSAFWWLEFYNDFYNHLNSRYQLVRQGDECIIYHLRSPETQPAGEQTD